MNYFRHLLSCSLIVAFAIVASQPAAANVINSYQSSVNATESSYSQVQAGADVAFLNAYDNAKIDISGGKVSWLNLYGQSSATISGGDVSWVLAHDQSEVVLKGLTDLSWLIVDITAHVVVVADDVSYSNGHLSGIWADGNAFDFWALQGPLSSSAMLAPNLSIVSTRAIPEPSALALFCLASLMLLTTKRGGTKE